MQRCRPLIAAFCALGLSHSPAQAETFAVNLGKTTLGQLVYQTSGKIVSLRTTLANTPLGVFNGRFESTTAPVTLPDGATGTRFKAHSTSSRKARRVTVDFAKGAAVATTVSPAKEETNLSDPAKAPKGVTDPARAIGQLITAKGCPGRINIYDGRRVISLIPKSPEVQGDTLICAMAYKVTAGPGHLSPLKISKARMQLHYATQNGQRIQKITLGSGPFNLVLNRTD